MHEVDEHINLTKELEDVHLGEKGSPHTVDNSVLGLDEGVEVRMPSDEFERSSGNEESTFMLSKVSLGTVEEQGAFGGIHEGQSPQLTDGSPQVSIDGSGRRDEDAGKAIQDLVIQPVNGPHTSVASNVLNSVDASISSSQTSLHPAPSSVNVVMHSSYGKAVTSTVSATPDWLHTDASPSTSPSWFITYPYTHIIASSLPVWSTQIYITYLPRNSTTGSSTNVFCSAQCPCPFYNQSES